jgi:hypothetical protein
MISEAECPGWASLGQAMAQPIMVEVTFNLHQDTSPVGRIEGPNNSNLVELPASPPSVHASRPLSDARFINMSLGASLGIMQVGVVPNDLDTFRETMTKQLSTTALVTPPPRRRTRWVCTTAVPRCSACMAKKASHRTPVLTATHNLLM